MNTGYILAGTREDYPCFADKETETKGASKACPKSDS